MSHVGGRADLPEACPERQVLAMSYPSPRVTGFAKVLPNLSWVRDLSITEMIACSFWGKKITRKSNAAIGFLMGRSSASGSLAIQDRTRPPAYHPSYGGEPFRRR